jgi:hypothetical protein
MKILTKKDLKKEFHTKKVVNDTKKKVKIIDELVDEDGGLVDGDENSGTDKITTGWNNPQTSREFSRKTSQGPRFYYNSRYGRQFYKESVEDKTKGDLDTIAENKVKNMIEDIMRRSSYDDNDFVSNYDNYEVSSRNENIPLFTELKDKHQKPILARKTLFLGDLMKKESVTGEELAIILNHLLNMIPNVEIPDDYKEELINKISNGEFKTKK